MQGRPIKTNKTVLCAIPCYNESFNLSKLFVDLQESRIPEICDVVFIDDGSTDATYDLISRCNYEIIQHARNQGYGGSVQTAFQMAVARGYESLIIFPGDNQRSATDLRRLIEMHQTTGIDILTGSKFHIYSERYGPIGRRFGNVIFSQMARYGWNSPIDDVLSGFKIYRLRKVAPFFHKLPLGYPFDICFSLYASRFKLTVKEIAVNCRYDEHTSKMRSVILVSMQMLMHLLLHFVFQPLICPYRPAKQESSSHAAENEKNDTAA